MIMDYFYVNVFLNVFRNVFRNVLPSYIQLLFKNATIFLWDSPNVPCTELLAIAGKFFFSTFFGFIKMFYFLLLFSLIAKYSELDRSKTSKEHKSF